MSQNKVQIESIMFDWRLYAERGLPSYLHHHEDGKRVDVCEIQFLNKVIFLILSLAFGWRWFQVGFFFEPTT